MRQDLRERAQRGNQGRFLQLCFAHILFERDTSELGGGLTQALDWQ